MTDKTLTNMNKSMPIVMTLISLCLYLAILAGVIIFLIIDSKDEPERLTSAAGVLAFVFIGFIFSAHPDKIRWRHVFWGIGLEFTLGLLVLRWEVISGRRNFTDFFKFSSRDSVLLTSPLDDE